MKLGTVIVFHLILMKLGAVIVTQPCVVLQFHQVSTKSDEKRKSFINSPIFCTEFQQSVSRIVKIVHSGMQVNSAKM